MKHAIVWLLLLCQAGTAATVDLEAVKREPDPGKRAEQALEVASQALKRARALPVTGGSEADLAKDLTTMVNAVELSLQSLAGTGRKPSKLSRYYKKGELRTREMVRQLENLIADIAFDSRPPAEKARDRMVELHEEYLLGVMSGK
jgi:hypothetical protein